MTNIDIYVRTNATQWLCVDNRFGKVFYIPAMEENKIYDYLQKKYSYVFVTAKLHFVEE